MLQPRLQPKLALLPHACLHMQPCCARPACRPAQTVAVITALPCLAGPAWVLRMPDASFAHTAAFQHRGAPAAMLTPANPKIIRR